MNKRLIMLVLALTLMTSGVYAQTLTTSDITYVKAIRAIKDLKKQIQVKEIEKIDALNVVRIQHDADLDALRVQLETQAVKIGLTLDDIKD